MNTRLISGLALAALIALPIAANAAASPAPGGAMSSSMSMKKSTTPMKAKKAVTKKNKGIQSVSPGSPGYTGSAPAPKKP